MRKNDWVIFPRGVQRSVSFSALKLLAGWQEGQTCASASYPRRGYLLAQVKDEDRDGDSTGLTPSINLLLPQTGTLEISVQNKFYCCILALKLNKYAKQRSDHTAWNKHKRVTVGVCPWTYALTPSTRHHLCYVRLVDMTMRRLNCSTWSVPHPVYVFVGCLRALRRRLH